MGTIQEVEAAVLNLIRDYIGAQSKQLGNLGLAYHVSIDRRSTESGYLSETRVEFSDENGPWDVLEFQIARQGRLVVSLDDVKKWLPDAFSSVVSRRQQEYGHSRPTIH